MARKTTKRARKTPQAPAKPPVSRRDAVTRMAWFGVGGVVMLGVGGAFAMDFRTKMAEGDLTKIGQGVPTIVQIHDPNCGLCRELQRETRAALKQFGGDEVLYLVANIQNIDGADFQSRMGLPNVSLVLFDADGNRVSYVQGVTPRAQLEQTFRRQLKL